MKEVSIGCIVLLVVIIFLQLYQISSIHKKEDYTENTLTEGRPSLQGSPYERELLQGELVLGYANYGGTNYDQSTMCSGTFPRYPI